MNEACAYKNDIRQLNDSLSKRKPANSPSNQKSSQIKKASRPQEPWRDQARRENSPLQSRAHMEEDSANSSEFMTYLTGNTSPASLPQMALGVGVHEGHAIVRPFMPFTRDGNPARDESLRFYADLNPFILRDTAGQAEQSNAALSASLNSNGSPAPGADQPPPRIPKRPRGPLEAGL